MRMLLNPCALTLSSSAWVMRGLPHEVSSEPVASSELPRFHPGCIAATAAIALPGTGLPDVVVVVVVVVVGGAVPPVQVTPLSANEAGAVLTPVHDPLKPNDTVPLVGIATLWPTFVAVT